MKKKVIILSFLSVTKLKMQLKHLWSKELARELMMESFYQRKKQVLQAKRGKKDNFNWCFQWALIIQKSDLHYKYMGYGLPRELCGSGLVIWLGY